MKKIILFLVLLLIMTIVSCKKKDGNPFSPQVEKSKATALPIPKISRHAKDSNSVKVATDGVNITTKKK